MAAAMSSAPWVLLSLPANFIISAMLTQYYGIGPGMYGLIASLPAWCNALQIALVPVLARFLNPRDMALSLSWLNLGLWLLLSAILGYLPADNARDAGHIFLIFFALTSFSSSFASVGWTAWIQLWVPEKIRGNHFGRRNRMTGIVTVAFLVLSMVLLDELEGSLWAYQSLIIITALGRFYSVMAMHPIVTPPGEDKQFGASDWLRQLTDLRHHPGFLRMVAINAWTGFWMGLVAPFIPVYAFNYLDVSPGKFAFLSILSSITAAAAMPIWGRVLDKNGCIPVMAAGLIFWRLLDFGWCFVTPQNNWILYIMWVNGGLFSAAFLLGQFNLILRLMPSHARTAAVSLNLAVMSLAAGIAPVLGGILLQDYAAKTDMPYRLGIGAMCLASILCVPFLRSIKEPEKGNPKGVLGAMRTARQILQLQGMSFASAANTIARKRLSPARPAHKTEATDAPAEATTAARADNPQGADREAPPMADSAAPDSANPDRDPADPDPDPADSDPAAPDPDAADPSAPDSAPPPGR